MTIICAAHGEGRFVGFTANSFNSVSLKPPLVLWTLRSRSTSLPAFEAVERDSFNVRGSAQTDLARRFSRPHADRFAGVDFRMGWANAPLIAGCAAWFECRHHSRHANTPINVAAIKPSCCSKRIGFVGTNSEDTSNGIGVNAVSCG